MSMIAAQTGLSPAVMAQPRQQCAALCYRTQGSKLQILLITSRGTKRWIIPKGWQVKGRTMAQSAVIEAWEEAGVIGRQHDTPLGSYGYIKIERSKTAVPCCASVFPIKVKSQKSNFPERGQRKLKWFSPKKAAQKVTEPELKALILGFDPRHL